MPVTESLIQLSQLTAAYRSTPVLKNINWQWLPEQRWAVVGGNSSGKTALAHILCDQLRPQRGSIQRHRDIDLTDKTHILHISFELQKQLIEYDKRFDDSEVREDAFDIGTRIRDIILPEGGEDPRLMPTATELGIAHILDRGIRFVSTGESRKALLARALLQQPKILIIDNPYEGLDSAAQQSFKHLLNTLLQSDLKILLLLQQACDIPQAVDHILYLEAGEVKACGDRASVLPMIQREHQSTANQTVTQLPPALPRSYQVSKQQPLIELQDVNVNFQQQPVLTAIDWQLQWGQHCQISGPNGAGKSTLLNLISGDNHQAYGQQVKLFGRQRGSGESVWDIKQKFGVVSTALQLEHIGRMRVAEVVASGLYDSIGLYQNCSGKERDIALQWLAALRLEAIAKQSFKQLSFGEQRLALLARAMVKSPLLLVLDEPCIGLDSQQRERVLQLLDAIAEHSDTHILYVSHTATERPDCINQQLQLVPHPLGGYTAITTEL